MFSSTVVVASLVFLSQIFVISIYTPRRRERFYGELLRRCPPEEYPHLYPGGTAHWALRGRVLRLLHYPIALGGLLVLAYGLANSISSEALAGLLLGWLMIQLLPWFLTMYWDVQGTRAFRKIPRPSIRKTELVPRKLDSLISPPIIFLVVVLYLGNTGLVFYAGAIDSLPWQRVGVQVATHCLMLGLIYWYFRKFMRTARDDPYESDDDYWVRARRTMRLFVSAVALAGVINFAGILAHLIAGPQESGILGSLVVSLLMQMVFILEYQWVWHQLDHRDYSVYRLSGNE